MHMAFKLFLWRAFRAYRHFILVSLFAFGVAVARAEVRFDVFLGYDGTVREATWFPITCEIMNSGPAFSGFIEVSPGSYGKGQTQRLPIELPTGTLKRVIIPTFAPAEKFAPSLAMTRPRNSFSALSMAVCIPDNTSPPMLPILVNHCSPSTSSPRLYNLQLPFFQFDDRR
jgi:hypothetical protein